METYLLILVFIIMWVALSKQVGSIEKKLDSLKKDIDSLRQQDAGPRSTASVQSSPVVQDMPDEPVEDISPEVFEEPEIPEYVLQEEESVLPESVLPEPALPVMEEEEEPVQPRRPKEKKKINYEKYIGENLFGKIGILILVIGVGLFVKYAIDKDWINEIFRTILGFVAGSALLAIAQRLQKKYRTFSSLLAGGAFGIFYVTVAIAYHYYGIFSQTMAFVLLIAFTVLMSLLAQWVKRRELAIIALVGGFIAPFLVSSGEGNYVVLFTYLSILNLSMFGLSLRNKWPELPVLSFAFTYLIMFIYTWNTGIEYNWEHQYEGKESGLYIKLLLFATLFYFIFLLPIISILKSESRRMGRLLLSVVVANNFIYLAFGMCYLSNIESPVRLNGLLTLFVAVVNLVLVLWLKRERGNYRFLVYSILGLVLTFISITVPVQLRGNYITLFWAAEMVLLLWMYVKSRIRMYEYFAALMVVGTLISGLMDMNYSIAKRVWFGPLTNEGATGMFLNGTFATGIFAGLAFLAFAWMMQRNKAFFETGKVVKYYHWNAWMIFTGVAFLYHTVVNELYQYLQEQTAWQSIFLFTSLCVWILCIVLRNRFPAERFLRIYIIGVVVSVGGYLLDVWSYNSNIFWGEGSVLLPWFTMLVTTATLFTVGKLYYGQVRYNVKQSSRFTVFLNIASGLFWLAVVNRFLSDLRLPDEFNAGFSIALALAGLVQMVLGMRLHWKLMRVLSLFTFGIVLVKLVLSDLWAMPTVGKILVFILLGGILLVLSFLYQKLKDVLFKDDADE